MNKRSFDIVTISLVILLLLCTTMTCLGYGEKYLVVDEPVQVLYPEYWAAASRSVTGELNRQETINGQALRLYDKNPEENIPFQMTNMFPGDSKTQYYRVSVSYTGTITVSFQAFVKEGGEELGKALKANVKLLNSGEILYEGAIADMPRLDYVLTTDNEKQTEELMFKVTVSLGTDAGNEYQNRSMTADLCWWAEGSDPEEPPETEEPSKPSEEELSKPSEEESEAPSGEESDKTESGSLVAPSTGDDSNFTIWLVMSVVIAVILLLLIRYRRKGQDDIRRSRSRLIRGMFLGVLLAGGLSITTLALVYDKVSVEDNYFITGTVSICLNDNQPVFDEDILFEPGMIVKKEFTLRNDSTCDVYYKLYFSKLDGELAEALTVVVADGNSTIYRGTLLGIAGEKSEEANGLLREGEERRMTMTFYVPEDCGNSIQDQTIWFDLHADAVQVVNNPDGLFE